MGPKVHNRPGPNAPGDTALVGSLVRALEQVWEPGVRWDESGGHAHSVGAGTCRCPVPGDLRPCQKSW